MRLTKAQREEVRMKFGGKCAYCGSDLPERWHADHMEAVERTAWGPDKGKMRRPDRDAIENLMPSCPPCNIDKHAMSLEGWRNKLARAIEVLANNYPTYRHAVRFGLVAETPKPVVFYFEKESRHAN